MKINEINKPIKEYRNVVTPRDEIHYREMMKTLHNLELKSASDPAIMAEIKRRKMELRNWAEQNLKREDKEEIGNYATLKSTGQDVRIVDFDENDNTYQISYGEGKGEDWVDGKDLEFIDPTVHQDLDDKILDKEVDERVEGGVVMCPEACCGKPVNECHCGPECEHCNCFMINKDETKDEGFENDLDYGSNTETSPLKETARMAIELIEILKNGGNIDESVQTILNHVADNLHGVYNYESYAKTNPYRQEIDSNTLSKHSQIIQKNIDEILARETAINDVDTKPGMLQILSKRVNEVEKEMAKEVRENTAYEDMLQNKFDSAVKEYDTPEKKKERDAMIKAFLAKGGKVEKVPAGKTAYKGKELKPAYKKDNGTPITSPGSDESIKEKEGAYKGDHAKIMLAIQNLQQMIVNAKMGNNEKTSALTSLDQVQQDIATLYDDAAGVGIITKQNTTADVKPGDEYKNVKKLSLQSKRYESKLTNMLNQRLK